MGAELFRVDGRTDITKLTGAFGKFAKAPKDKATVVIGHNTASPDIRFPDVSKQYRGHIFRCLNVPEFFLGHLDTSR